MATFPLPVSVHIAPGADPTDYSTYQFTEITSDVMYSSAVQIQAGRQDESSQANTTGHALTLLDQSGNYSTHNPNGAYYPLLGIGTPLQTRVKLIDDLLARTVAGGFGTDPVSGNAWTSNSAYSVNGSNGLVTLAAANSVAASQLLTVLSDDVDIYKVSSLSAVTTGASWVDATEVRWQDAFNLVYVHTEYSPGGLISVKIVQADSGTQTILYNTTATAVSYSAGTKIATRVQAVGPTIRIKVWLASGAEPGAWTASADMASTTVRGNAAGLYQWRVAGNTNAGSLTSSIYEFRCDTIRATTPVPEWSPRWNQPLTLSTTSVVGAGILRRLSQGQSALRSPLYRGLLQQKPAAFWPLEDGTDASAASSAVAGGGAAQTSNVTFAAAGPPGASSAITVNAAGSSIFGSVVGSPNTPDGYACLILVKFASLPGSTTPIAQWTTTGTVTNWSITGNGTALFVTGTDSTGSTVVAPGGGSLYVVDPTQWWAVQLETNVSGGTVTWTLLWTQVSGGPFFFTTGSYSGTAKKATGFQVGGLVGASYSMSWLGDNDLNFVSASFSQLASGFAGETAGRRLMRLANENNVPLVVMGNPDSTAQMGVQTAQKFIDLAQECEDAEQGFLLERGVGLGFLTYDFRTNVPVSTPLDFAAGHISTPPQPTDDDQNLINEIKLSRAGGGEVTVDNLASIALRGTYTDEKTVNLFVDGQLAGQAGWRLHLGTAGTLRWPQITLRLHGTPSLISAWCGMRVGSRFTVANPPAAIPGETIDLIILGYTETITALTWDVVLNCAPAKPWDVGVYGTALTGSSSTVTGSTLPAATGSASLTLTYTTPADRWSTTATGYTVLVNGEVMTVTAMGAASGTSPAISQTATVTRAANGISIAHATGESVQVYPVAIYSL